MYTQRSRASVHIEISGTLDVQPPVLVMLVDILVIAILHTQVYIGVCNFIRVRMTEERERRLKNLLEATGENTKSGAIDAAAKYYVRMAGGTNAVPAGKLEELMQLATEQGSATAGEIAEILETVELAGESGHSWRVGN
jgi:hypothetical protein